MSNAVKYEHINVHTVLSIYFSVLGCLSSREASNWVYAIVVEYLLRGVGPGSIH